MISPVSLAGRLPSPLVAGLRTVLQILVLILVWAVGAGLVEVLSVPVSAGVVGMLLVLALLLSGVLPVERVQLGAEWMLGELVLFFIPAVVAVVQYGDLLRRHGLGLAAAVVLGTVLVMVTTALVVRLGCALEHRLARRARYRRWRRLRRSEKAS